MSYQRKILDYDYFLVCSFEFTCDGKRSLEPQEMIEFCVLKFNLKTLIVEDKFYSFVKPQHEINATLSTFCKMLTCISDRKIANAPSLQDLLIEFDTWMWKQGLYQTRFIFVPHTHFDLQHMLPAQCKAMGYHCPNYFFTWLHLEEMYKQHEKKNQTNKPAVKQIRRRSSAGMLQTLGIQQEGRAHSAEDNCKNTVNMVKTMSEKGVDFTAKIWQTFVSRKKNGEQGDDYDEDEDDEEEELADLEEDKTMAMARRVSTLGIGKMGGSGRTTPDAGGRITPGGRTTPGRQLSHPSFSSMVDKIMAQQNNKPASTRTLPSRRTGQAGFASVVDKLMMQNKNALTMK